MRLTPVALLLLTLPAAVHAQRARDAGVPFDGAPGPLNAITDVPGVRVGHATLIRGEGRLEPGKGPVRTGVTAVFPTSESQLVPVYAGWFSLNGNGEMTGTAWIEEYGILPYPVAITNTNSVGVVRDAVIEWGARRLEEDAWHCCLPPVAETWDGDLNDIFGFHVTRQDAFRALDSARGGPVQEGNVGGGTGMSCLGFKGGIGTSSRRIARSGYTVGVLVQCNFGGRNQLRIAGIPVARELPSPPRPCYDTRESFGDMRDRARCAAEAGALTDGGGDGLAAAAERPGPAGPREGSIIVVVATDAPLLPHQLKRIAKRASLGIGRVGGTASSGSGDLFIAFSTRPVPSADSEGRITVLALEDNQAINGLYEATVQATEEAIINAMFAAETMTGADWYREPALPKDQVREVLRNHGLLREP